MNPAHAGLASACAALAAVPMTGTAFAIPTEGSLRMAAGWWHGRPGRPRMALAVAALTAAAVFGVALRLPASPAAIAYLATAIGGIALAAVDLRVRRLPFPLTGALYAISAASLAINEIAGYHQPGESLGRAAEATVILAAAFLILALVFPGQLGLGDVSLVGVLAGTLAYRSLTAGLLGVVLGMVIQLPAAIIGLVTRGRNAALPLGPALVAGWLIAIAAAL